MGKKNIYSANKCAVVVLCQRDAWSFIVQAPKWIEAAEARATHSSFVCAGARCEMTPQSHCVWLSKLRARHSYVLAIQHRERGLGIRPARHQKKKKTVSGPFAASAHRNKWILLLPFWYDVPVINAFIHSVRIIKNWIEHNWRLQDL